MLPRTPPFLALALALAAPAWAHGGPPTGQVLVINESGGTVRVELPGATSQTLRAGDRAVFESGPGETTVKATYRQLGTTQVLETERAIVRPHRTSVVVLEPADHTHVLVTNDTRFDAELLVDGQYVATLTAGESEIVSVDLGSSCFELVARNGRRLDMDHLDVRAFRDNTWVVSLPTTAHVTVVNPLPIPVDLVTGRGTVRTVPARGKTVYEDVPFGTFEVSAFRGTGELVDKDCLRVGERGAEWVIDAPTRGQLLVDSDTPFPTRVLVDGQVVASLPAYGDARIEVSVGWHEVELVDDRGRRIEETWLEIDPFRISELDVDREHRRPQQHAMR